MIGNKPSETSNCGPVAPGCATLCRLEAIPLHDVALNLNWRILAVDRPGIGASTFNPVGELDCDPSQMMYGNCQTAITGQDSGLCCTYCQCYLMCLGTTQAKHCNRHGRCPYLSTVAWSMGWELVQNIAADAPLDPEQLQPQL